MRAILYDRGYLTNLRTAYAVRIASEIFLSQIIDKVGVLGTGIQARLAVQEQAKVTNCKNIIVWGRT